MNVLVFMKDIVILVQADGIHHMMKKAFSFIQLMIFNTLCTRKGIRLELDPSTEAIWVGEERGKHKT